MDAFLTKKRKLPAETTRPDGDDEPTDVKLAILASLHPAIDQATLLDVLIAHDGSVSETSAVLKAGIPSRKSNATTSGYQSSLRHFAQSDGAQNDSSPSKKRLLSKKGVTMHLHDPVDVAAHTPCTIVHNFLPADDANDLLKELLEESQSFEKITFKLFENVVSSPHTMGFYVESYDDIEDQKTAYLYNGARLRVGTPRNCPLTMPTHLAMPRVLRVHH